MTGPLCAGLADLLAARIDHVGRGPAGERLRAGLAALAEPAPRLAVVGEHGDGASTLVDVILGARATPVGRVPTAAVACWFRYGEPAVLLAIVRDGDPRAACCEDGPYIPADLAGLGLKVEEVDRLVLRAPIEALRHWTVLDLPGVRHCRTWPPAALAEADAVLLVLPEPGPEPAEAIEAIRRFAVAAGLTAANTVGVLSRPERFGMAGEDPWPDMHRGAGAYAAGLRGLVADPVPVAGLLGAAALPGGFTEGHARAVRVLRAADPDRLAMALTDEWEFRDWTDGPLTREQRLQLADVIGMHGIRELVAAAGAHDLSAQRTVLRDRSGVDTLLGRISGPLLAAADRLRCTRVLAAAERAVRDAGADHQPGIAALGDELTAYRNRPELAQVRLSDALTDLLSGRWVLPAAEAAAIEALATGVDAAGCLGLAPDTEPARVAAAARRAAEQWAAWESADVSDRLGRHARAARELCQQVARSARDGSHGVAPPVPDTEPHPREDRDA
ncbi:hypothetical protein [Pseudonocardia acidicola]|uniref:Dynamin family protein n=1 Tax=Pseudonocardia acidicola TaxID=2724939 RepID=A0ABX1SK16_9PSEU|nr:hypothetical protein [Pseudonocardia acidicola]NMI00610.1 hypothetical protein [Pseudonocardia acidicola]